MLADSTDKKKRRSPSGKAIMAQLVVDMGMNDGTDTAYYLAKGLDVVAIEANPDWPRGMV